MKRFLTLWTILVASSALLWAWSDPTTSQSFGAYVAGMTQISAYNFGTGCGKNVTNATQLGTNFNAYSGSAGTGVIHQEWERYQTFSSSANFVFTPSSLNLTATIPSGGGLFAGGIYSGQIWSKQTFIPGTHRNTSTTTSYNIYAFEVRMQIPHGTGTWPAHWFYSAYPDDSGAPGDGNTNYPHIGTDGSEIDNPEFFVYCQNCTPTQQDTHDWTGFQHGPGRGSSIYDLRSSNVYNNGTDWAAAYHNYQTVWTPDAVYKYIDGTLIYAEHFTYSSGGDAQWGINLAVGSDETASGSYDLPRPTSTSIFPAALAVDHVYIWGMN